MVMRKQNNTLWLEYLNNYTKFVTPSTSALYVLVKQHILLFSCANTTLYIAKGLKATRQEEITCPFNSTMPISIARGINIIGIQRGNLVVH